MNKYFFSSLAVIYILSIALLFQGISPEYLIKGTLVFLMAYTTLKRYLFLEKFKKTLKEKFVFMSERAVEEAEEIIKEYKFVSPFLFFIGIFLMLLEVNIFLYVALIYFHILYYPNFIKEEKLLDIFNVIKDNNNVLLYIKEIKNHLNIFSETSQFRIRVMDAIRLIEEINLYNRQSLNSLEKKRYANADLISVIEEKSSFLENSLKNILKSVIEYNNERNEIILEKINKNIETLNKLRNW